MLELDLSRVGDAVTRIIDLEKVLAAVDRFDWSQPVGRDWNPCFWLEADGHFCGRAQAWGGHGSDHNHLPLRVLIEALIADQTAHLRETMLQCSRDIWHMSMEHISDRLREEAERL